MGHKLVKHLDAAGYNRKLFYLDRGAIDLPPIVNFTDIQPGSESRSLLTGEKWILNTHYKWIYIDENWCGCCGSGTTTPGGGQNGSGIEPVTPGEEPTIQGVTISPSEAKVGLGTKISFTASVKGDPTLSQEVTWSIKGQKSPKTVITPDGILMISPSETSNKITVKVVSQLNSDKFAVATVAIDATIEEPTEEKSVTGISISPKDAEVCLGHALAFNCKVAGINLDDFSVSYFLTNQRSENTKINKDGILTVSSDETSPMIVVTARPNADPLFFATATISLVPETHTTTPANQSISEVAVYPPTAKIAKGYNTQFAAVVKSVVGTPSQEVVWTLSGANSADTRITSEGVVYVGENEESNLLTLTARSVHAPDKFAEVDIQVLAHETPEAEVSTIDAIVISPASSSIRQGENQTFAATVVGKNNPPQGVSWGLFGANAPTTYISEYGTLVVGVGETSRSLKIIARSKVDLNKYNYAYVTVELPDLAPYTGIEDVPNVPLNTKYIRERNAAGKSVWTALPPEVDPNEQGPEPEISSVTISPEAATVRPNATIEFAALLEGSDELSDVVTWSVAGNQSGKTKITSDGVLSVGMDESSKIIKVKAVSVADPSKVGSATIVVDPFAEVHPEVSGIYLIPASCEATPGKKVLFQGIVTGINLNNQQVAYKVEGNQNEFTNIDEHGVLTIHKDEASSVLIVTATSKANSKFSDTAVISVIPEEVVEKPTLITAITVLPTYTTVGRGLSTHFGVQVTGTNNPSADVVWTLGEHHDNATHISRDGVLYVGENEALTELTITATSVSEPDKFSEARAKVVSKEAPGVAETRVDAVIVTPPSAEVEKGSRLILRASVIGTNDPDPRVKWELDGNLSNKTTVNSKGVLNIANDESAKVLKINAISVADPTKFSTSYVSLLETVTTPDTGIEEVPKAPFNTDYVRRRDKNGKAYWTKHQDSGGRPNAKLYIGTFENVSSMRLAGIPGNAMEGDFAYVKDDETKNRCPSMYEVATNNLGELEYRFTMSFGRPPILGDKLDTLFVLDNGTHSELIKDIVVLEDFNTNDKRYELHQSPSAWHLVTELHKGYWETIKKHPDWYKMVVGMQDQDGSVKAYLTCVTDHREFKQLKTDPVNNPDPVVNTLTWTNTVGKANTFTAANGGKYRRYKFDPNTMTMKVIYSETIPPETNPGVAPWATVVGEYSMLSNGKVIGPLANVTDPTGYVWVSDHEKFMIGSAGDGTEMFCYLPDTDEYFIFSVPAGRKDVYQLATDIHERYFMMFIDREQFIWGDILSKQTFIGRWDPQGYSGLSTPTALTRPSISPDGQYYLHTSTNPSTPAFTTFKFSDGTIAAEGPVTGTSSSSIGMDGNKIFTNTPEGLIVVYDFDPQNGKITELHRESPYAARYVVQFTAEGNQVLCVKVEDKKNCPVWFVYNVDQQRVTDQSKDLSSFAKQTNPQGKGCVYQISTAAGERYMLSMADNKHGYVVYYERGQWKETQIPFGGLNNNPHEYNQPILMKDGSILITQDEAGNPQGFDVSTMQPVDIEQIKAPGKDPHMIQIDSQHMMWCTDNGSQLIRIDSSGTQTTVLEIPEQQVLVFGFEDSDVRKERGG